jgi:translation initiation factor 4E
MGGKFSIRLKKGLVSRLWEELLLALVGDQFEAGDQICGVVVSIRFKDTERKRDVLSVWIKDSNNIQARESIEQQLRIFLHLPDSIEIEYKPHSSSLQDLEHIKEIPHKVKDGGHEGGGGD